MLTRVLVVDDSPTIRKVVSSILDEEGYEIVTAEDGEGDPAVRRTQLAQSLAGSVVRAILPALRTAELLPRISDEKFSAAVRTALGPEQVGALAGLLRNLDFGADARIILSGDLSCISIAE